MASQSLCEAGGTRHDLRDETDQFGARGKQGKRLNAVGQASKKLVETRERRIRVGHGGDRCQDAGTEIGEQFARACFLRGMVLARLP